VCALCVQNDLVSALGEPEAWLCSLTEQAHFEVNQAVSEFALQDALRAIFELVAAANRYADSSAPWQLAKLRREATTDAERERAHDALRRSLANLVEALRVTAELLASFLPDTARGIRERLAPCPHLAEPLFPALRPG
jgi:methionyl-tRNA synthetase